MLLPHWKLLLLNFNKFITTVHMKLRFDEISTKVSCYTCQEMARIKVLLEICLMSFRSIPIDVGQ